jgi:hypothetical protein
MKLGQILIISTIIGLFIGGGLYLLINGDGIPGVGSTYSPSFRTLEASIYGPTDVLVERKNYIFRTEKDYQAFWELLHGNEATAKKAPVVSFGQNHVIAVVGGVSTIAGADIYIKDIIDGTEDRVIQTVVVTPEEGCEEAREVLNPYHLVVVKKTDKPLKAAEIKEVYRCGE